MRTKPGYKQSMGFQKRGTKSINLPCLAQSTKERPANPRDSAGPCVQLQALGGRDDTMFLESDMKEIEWNDSMKEGLQFCRILVTRLEKKGMGDLKTLLNIKRNLVKLRFNASNQ